MVVYIVVHHWCNTSDEGCEICDGFFSRWNAVERMKILAAEARDTIAEEWEKQFHPDFENGEDDYISFGFYTDVPYTPDCTWSWSIEPVEVQ